jgi:hypothetical protein
LALLACRWLTPLLVLMDLLENFLQGSLDGMKQLK